VSARLTFTTPPKFVKHLIAAHLALADSRVPPRTLELMNIRASQINGCGACLDMHTKEAAHAGETALRMNLVGAWRETTVFTDAERAALELTEQGTRLADTSGITDEAWVEAARHYQEEQLAVLAGQISLINAFNRLNVILKQPGGSYQIGHSA
jgi:AhpD family alkylhydroperoxidase